MPQIINVSITVKSVILLLAATAVVWLLAAFDKILLTLFLAILLAVAINPLVNRLQRGKVPRALAIVLVYLALLSILGGVIGLLIPVLAAETSDLTKSLPGIAQQVFAFPTKWITPYFPSMAQQLSAGNISDQLSGGLGTVVGSAGGFLVGVGKTLTTLFISLFLILVVGFFMVADARFAPRVIARFFPPQYRQTAANLARQIGTRMGHWARAQALVGLFFGVVFGIGLKVAGVKYALTLGVAGAVLEIIPYVGGVIITVLGMLIALASSVWLALFVLGWYIVVANIESHVVYPKLVGEIVGLHPLVIIIALFVGAELKGVLGALLAVPVTVIIQVLFDYYYRFEEPAAETTPAAATATPTSTAAERPPAIPAQPSQP